jgi:SAM domain (Sterile alpha motif)
MTIQQYLTSLGLEKYIAIFEEKQIKMEDLPFLDKADLAEIGISDKVHAYAILINHEVKKYSEGNISDEAQATFEKATTVEEHLDIIGYAKYLNLFVDNNLDYAQFNKLSLDDLKNIGIKSIVDRKKIFDTLKDNPQNSFVVFGGLMVICIILCSVIGYFLPALDHVMLDSFKNRPSLFNMLLNYDEFSKSLVNIEKNGNFVKDGLIIFQFLPFLLPVLLLCILVFRLSAIKTINKYIIIGLLGIASIIIFYLFFVLLGAALAPIRLDTSSIYFSQKNLLYGYYINVFPLVVLVIFIGAGFLYYGILSVLWYFEKKTVEISDEFDYGFFPKLDRKETTNNTINNIDSFLDNIELPQHKTIFKDQEISYTDFLKLSSEDLSKIGVHALGHRKKILEKIDNLNDNGSLNPLAISNIIGYAIFVILLIGYFSTSYTLTLLHQNYSLSGYEIFKNWSLFTELNQPQIVGKDVEAALILTTFPCFFGIPIILFIINRILFWIGKYGNQITERTLLPVANLFITGFYYSFYFLGMYGIMIYFAYTFSSNQNRIQQLYDSIKLIYPDFTLIERGLGYYMLTIPAILYFVFTTIRLFIHAITFLIETLSKIFRGNKIS